MQNRRRKRQREDKKIRRRRGERRGGEGQKSNSIFYILNKATCGLDNITMGLSRQPKTLIR